MVPTMSTTEVLRFHAALRLGSALSAAQRTAKVDNTLHALGLARARDTQVCTLQLQAAPACIASAALRSYLTPSELPCKH